MADWKNLSRFLEEITHTGPVGNGCAAARDGELLFEEYHGYADAESMHPIDAATVYRQYSTTKVVICTAAMILYERGGFLLNDPISDYFPEWKDTLVVQKQEDGSVILRPASRPIQVKDCFTMSMGIGYGGEDYTHLTAEKVRAQLKANVGDYTLRQDIQAMASVPVAFDPGTHWLYGFGHELVAGLIEVISGKKVSEFLKEELFEPLRMQDTDYHYRGDLRERLVQMYRLNEDGSRERMDGFAFDERFEPDARYEAGGAGLFSSVRDYLAFTQMLACGGTYKGTRIMGRKTIDLMRTNQLQGRRLAEFADGPYLEGYGYGLGVRTLLDPAAGISSSPGEFGWTGMLGTYISIDPAEKLSLVYMHNLSPNLETYIHPRIRNMVYGNI